MGFYPPLLTDHFDRHRGEFPGITTEEEYEALADTFLGDLTTQPGVEECIRRTNRDFIRYNTITEEFGILAADQYIRTYFKPDPGKHGLPTNHDYFLAECAKE